MKRKLVSLLFFVAALVVLSSWISAVHAFEVQAEPMAVMPGDAFVVRVSGVKGNTLPEAFFISKPLSFASCGDGCFFAIGATDSKTGPGKRTIEVTVGTKKKRLPITIRRHVFPVIQLTLPPGKVSLSQEDTERADREDKLLKSFWTQCSEKVWQGRFSLPMDNEISTQYGVKRVINKTKESIHHGIDIRGKEGDDVRAANSGKIVLAEELFFGGYTLVLDHGMGIFTVYMHMSGFNRKLGESVSKGDVIGFVGSTGRSTGPHLHFGIKAQELSVNPVSFAKLKL
ncbi:MAG: M23 family metallopeptidase [Nitrospirota bacterium]|nr:M23 family metallopeptidase [Nitrospirota bacterium]